MTRDSRSKGVVLALCIGAFCVAMGLRESVNIWLGTGCAAVISAFLLRRVEDPPAIGWPVGITAKGVIVGVGTGLSMAFATWALYPISARVVPAISEEVPKLYALLREPPGPVWAFPILTVVVATEEWVWRGLAIDVLERLASSTWAVVLAALLYILPQVALRSPLLVVVALVCGLVWGALRVWTRGLIAPLIAHLLWDLLVFVLFPVA